VTRREFLEAIAAGVAAALPLAPAVAHSLPAADDFYRLPPVRPKEITLLHFTDCHAQLMPMHFREPDTNIGVAAARNAPPHLVGYALLRHFGIKPGTPLAYAHTHLDFDEAAARYGKLGGFAHLMTLLRLVRAQRPEALLLDGGDSWQGSATALWSEGRDMISASKLLGVDMMTGHWEFTYGSERVMSAVSDELAGSIQFLAQNIRTADFGDPVFERYSLRLIKGVPVAIIGQAFPYTPIAHPRRFVQDWTFGIQEDELQRCIDEVRSKGAWVVVLLSHNGMDVDLKLASRITGLDAILGGHTHDAVPQPVLVSNMRGKTLVTNAGCNGKFLAVLDLQASPAGVQTYRYRLLPVFSNLLPADQEMSRLIDAQRQPFASRLSEKLASTQQLLYRRSNFGGTLDQLILEALLHNYDAQIAFSPGFRWGTTLMPGDYITAEHVMAATAITYPQVTARQMTGAELKVLLEDICDNLFNPDPYYQQGGDMVRVGGMTFSCEPRERIGRRIGNLRVRGEPISASARFKVVSWASVADGVEGEPIWSVVSRYLQEKNVIDRVRAIQPQVIGEHDNRGISRVG